MGPEEVSEEEVAVVASGLCTSQLLVMKWTAVDVAETGVLTGMFGGDIVKEAEAEVVRGFVGDEIKVDVFELSLGQPRQGHEPEEEQCGSEWTSTCLILCCQAYCTCNTCCAL